MSNAERVKDLMAQGLSLEQALEQVIDEIKQSNVIINRVEWIKTLPTIREVRRATHVAHSKKAKAAKLEKKAWYQEEVDAGNARLNELLIQAESQEDPIEGLIKLGEEPSGILHRWIRTREAELREMIRDLEGTNKEKRQLVNSQDASTPKSVQEELKRYGLLDLYQERVDRGDQGVIAINRKVRAVEKVGK